jgi:ABC-type glycerol-3-phosphate transport system substrate-binding protein
VDPFAADLLPMAFQGSWATTFMRDSIGDKFGFDCTAMPLSPTGESCINAAGGAWGIAANTANVEAAWTFLKFLTSTESTDILISEPLRSIPGRKSSVPLWNEKAAEGGLPPKNVTAFAQQMEIANAAPYPPYWQDYGTAWNNMIAPMIGGVTSDGPDTVLPAFQEEVNRLIAQFNAS